MYNDSIQESIRPKDSFFSGNFWITVKKDIIENRKSLLFRVGGIWGICISIGAFLGYYALGGSYGELMSFSFLFLLLGCVIASISFSNLINKDKRIASILVPDTSFDKFLIRWLAVVPLLCCVAIAGFYLLELSRIAVFKLSYDADMVAHSGSYCNVLNLWEAFGPKNTSMDGSLRGTFIMSYFFSQSFYILGAVLWPKLSFLKTFAALWVLQTLFSIVVFSIDRINLAVNFDTNMFLWCVTGFEFVVTIVIYWLAYLRFRGTQVVYKLF